MKDTSTPAFPPHYSTMPGMTLRQWYAGMALQGWAAGRNNGSDFHSESKPDHVSDSCFKYADAMIAAAEK